MDSRVDEKTVLLGPSLLKLDHDSLVVGHSLKKGCTGSCSCCTGPAELISLPKNESFSCCFGMVESMGSKARSMCCWEEESSINGESDFCFKQGLEET